MKKITCMVASALLSASAFALPATAGENADGGYLFVYFTGNDIDEEAVRYAVSDNGLDFRFLNNNRPVIDSKVISKTGGVRDPYIFRGEDGKTFYMTLTDMVSARGWDSNRGLVLLKSNDLLNWTSTAINFQERFDGNEDLKRVWAPQAIFDKEAGRHMVYFSMQHGDGPDIIYYAYANDDFTDLLGEPKVLFTPSNGLSCIDGDIVFKDGLYHLFYKTEGHGNGIKKATTKSLTSGKWTESDDYKQQTDRPVEGSGIFRMTDSGKYILMYDVYMDGAYQFTESTDLDNFKVIDADVTMDFHPRHGAVMAVSAEEMRRLRTAFPNSGSEFRNPVLPGWHADPEILYSDNTKRYYIYSTTDGTPGWGGTYFTCYSSPDLKEWTYEGIPLDVVKDVAWASGNAWAPAIEERLEDGKYRYYFYFSAHNEATGRKEIGVSVGNNPAGPFVSLGHPIVSDSPVGYGQQIDVDVFTDPRSGKPYLYWGNGYMAGAELNPDMLSIKEETMRVMTPEGGTLDDYAFREAPYVFFRDGTYYFMWSVDDTGSPNYHVAYGTSDSPLGPIKVADDMVVLRQSPDAGIFGPAHNAVLKLPGQDEWVTVYHRINPEYLGNEPGIHRQVCIDRLEFAPDGKIQKVTLR